MEATLKRVSAKVGANRWHAPDCKFEGLILDSRTPLWHGLYVIAIAAVTPLFLFFPICGLIQFYHSFSGRWQSAVSDNAVCWGQLAVGVVSAWLTYYCSFCSDQHLFASLSPSISIWCLCFSKECFTWVPSVTFATCTQIRGESNAIRAHRYKTEIILKFILHQSAFARRLVGNVTLHPAPQQLVFGVCNIDT